MDFDDGIAIEPFNVLTLVDAISGALKVAGISEPCHLREWYDLASEWAHPNAGGYIDWDCDREIPRPSEVANAAQWINLGSSITAFQRLVDYLDRIL
jgi:hypothetical protein